jgi:hypothetical protein
MSNPQFKIFNVPRGPDICREVCGRATAWSTSLLYMYLSYHSPAATVAHLIVNAGKMNLYVSLPALYSGSPEEISSIIPLHTFTEKCYCFATWHAWVLFSQVTTAVVKNNISHNKNPHRLPKVGLQIQHHSCSADEATDNTVRKGPSHCSTSQQKVIILGARYNY